ncbi:phage P22-like portal protein [Buttiauxella sp. JUb87]|uniref:portal protein n=1 Tax=Buttiauxella sp. JUb87 TaxID=2485129 RepID=UPI00105E9AD5|nr:portal protein [Buttiauxella sp. JUb87]TDN54637.1 phage P22-like portal protein [Buttiauxella sp. JUb87]
MKNKKEFHEIALKRFDAAYTPQTGIRESIRRAIRFARKSGAQWEGDTASGWTPSKTMKKRPMLEVNKTANSIERITAEGKNARISVKFRPGDSDASAELAEKLNGKFRADFNGCEGEEASDTAYEDAVAGGFGCLRLTTAPDNEDAIPDQQGVKRIVMEYVPEAYTTVWFDAAAKRYDKSDGTHAFEQFTMSHEAYKQKYKKDPASLESPSAFNFDWFASDLVYIARYYERRQEEVNIITYLNPLTGHSVVYEEEDIEKVKDELADYGYQKTGEELQKRWRVYCSVIDGEGILEEPVLLPGTMIPLVPYYGKRFYNEGKEQVEGFTQKAMDPQRALNIGFSMLTKEAIEARPAKMIVNTKFIAGLETIWGDPSDKAYMPMHDAALPPGGPLPKDSPPAFSQTQPTVTSPAVQQLIATADNLLTQMTGNAITEQGVPNNTSGRAVNTIAGRTDQQDYNFIDNLKKSTRHLGRVWLSMLRDVSGSDRVVRIVKPNGKDELITLNAQVKDEETGEVIGLNDLSQGKYDVVVGVGPAFASSRQQAIANLTAIMAAVPLPPEIQSQMALYMVDEIAGEGLDDLKNAVNRQLLLTGAKEPETPAEAKQVQQFQQQQAAAAQNSPENIIAQSSAMKAQADMFRSVAQLIDTGIGVFDTEADIQLKGTEMLKNLSDIEVSRAGAITEIANSLHERQQSLITSQLQFLGDING